MVSIRSAVPVGLPAAAPILLPMLNSLSPTDVAFVMAGLMQAVLMAVWLVGAWAAAETRRATLNWAAYAGTSAVSFVLLVAALRQGAGGELLRAGGNVLQVLGMLALQRGVRYHIGRPVPAHAHTLGLVLVLAASWLGLDPAHGALRVGVNSAVLTAICLSTAQDLHHHARATLRLRWPALLALPLLLAGIGFAQRGLRALADPAAVAAQMTTDSALNVGSALAYVVIALAFHAVLMTLVVARLVAELRHRSRHDGLTGMLNRRGTEELLAEQLQRSLRSGEPFVVMMLDLDHFKSINDRLGHAGGDLALQHAAAVLHAALRKVDRLGRFGGEEFLALLPAITLAEAQGVAERLRTQLAAAPLEHAGAVVPLSVSIGLAAWDGAAEDLSRLLVRADRALYLAKRNGRDRVELAPVEPNEPVPLAAA
jgi:diguanylate cyclase (GGDEF)-like protein